MADTFTYDLTTNRGKVRFALGDTDLTTTSGARNTWTCLFTDAEVDYLLDKAGDDVDWAVAYGLEVIAADPVLLVSRIKLTESEEDHSDVRKDLLAMSKHIRDRMAEEPADGFAEQNFTDFSFREIVHNAALRNS